MQPGPIILPYKGVYPTIAEDAFIAPGAVIIGDVEIGSGSGVWFACVLRGDVAPIRVGENTNIQDGTIVHVARDNGPCLIGSGITIGHKALVHACTLEDGSFVGMGAIVMDFTVVQTGAMVAAGAMVTPNKTVPTGELWGGRPAKYMRDLSEQDLAGFGPQTDHYRNLAATYRHGLGQGS